MQDRQCGNGSATETAECLAAAGRDHAGRGIMTTEAALPKLMHLNGVKPRNISGSPDSLLFRSGEK